MSPAMKFQEAALIIKQSLDIVDVISRHVALKRAGRNFLGLCPFHQEKSPSFNVSAEKQVFKCFGCGEGGDTLSFLMKIENKTYGEVIRDLAEDRGIEILREGRDGGRGKDETEILYSLQTLAQKFFSDQLKSAQSASSYLEERQVSATWQTHFGLGFAPPGWENLVAYLRQHEPAVVQNPSLLEKSGLANIRSEANGYYDRFRNRLIIPIHDDRGRIVAFGGRSMDPEDKPKYLNSPETDIYHKNRVLYGLSLSREAIRTSRYAILMEGYFDVISAHMAGIPQAVGVCGTSLTENHLKLLQRAGAETLYLCFDSDEAGQTAAVRAIDLIQHQLLDQGLGLKVMVLPGEKDPDDFLKHHGAEAFQECMTHASDFLSFKFTRALSKIQNLHAAEGRIQAVQTIAPMLVEIRQPVVRHEHIKWLSEQLNLTEETLHLEVKRLEQQDSTYVNKKNYASSAIFSTPDRYIERQRSDRPKRRPSPEDMNLYRQRLSQKLLLEEKEHLLLSYLLVDEESYRTVMDTLSHIQIQSPKAVAFLDTLRSLQEEWTRVDQLVQHLTVQFHSQNNAEQLQFLANLVMSAQEIEESYENASKGLKSSGYREKLSRDIQDLTKAIVERRKHDELKALAQHGKQCEQDADDQLALQVQLQLREQLKMKRSRTASRPALQDVHTNPLSLVEEEQGV